MGAEINPFGVRIQLKSENRSLERMITNANEMKGSITEFIDNSELTGEAYSSAKNYYSSMHIPLINAIMWYADDKQQENANYLSLVDSYFPSSAHVSEDQLLDQKSNIQRMQAQTAHNPFMFAYNHVLQLMEQAVNDKLNKIYDYLNQTKDLYTNIAFLDEIEQGIRCLKMVEPDTETGGFTIPPLDTSWITRIQELEDEKFREMAMQQYEEYLKENPADLDKIIAILKYEVVMSDADIQKVNTFLDPLETQDIIGIKSLAYSAEEPFRSLFIKYLDKFEITSTTESGVFFADQNSMRFNLENDRTNSCGAYYTFFHEVGHAIDYYYGLENGGAWYSSNYQNSDGLTLTDTIYNDVENNFRQVLDQLSQNPAYSHWSEAERNNAINSVVENLLANNTNSLSPEQTSLQNDLRREYRKSLSGADNECPSDIYGAVTNNTVIGSWGHTNIEADNSTYWVNADGTTKRDPNKECFAEYYGRVMTQGETSEKGLNSIETYLPESKEYLEDMFANME